MRGRGRRTPRTFLERKVLGTPKNFRTARRSPLYSNKNYNKKAPNPQKISLYHLDLYADIWYNGRW
jgi:hypothetical protein